MEEEEEEEKDEAGQENCLVCLSVCQTAGCVCPSVTRLI